MPRSIFSIFAIVCAIFLLIGALVLVFRSSEMQMEGKDKLANEKRHFVSISENQLKAFFAKSDIELDFPLEDFKGAMSEGKNSIYIAKFKVNREKFDSFLKQNEVRCASDFQPAALDEPNIFLAEYGMEPITVRPDAIYGSNFEMVPAFVHVYMLPIKDTDEYEVTLCMVCI